MLFLRVAAVCDTYQIYLQHLVNARCSIRKGDAEWVGALPNIFRLVRGREREEETQDDVDGMIVCKDSTYLLPNPL